jgi:hypothetical protein
MRQGKFELSVLVGGVPLPELTTGAGEVYVETKFNTHVSYKVEVEEVRCSCGACARRQRRAVARVCCGVRR